MPRHVVVGTAGHVDHGKSSLVRALTGTDPDRLKEEQERGITIDLGFAHLAEHDGVILSFVDVPGHERFVRNMLAGAAGVDVVLLVVAADESVMPQTREHLDICRLLGVESGVVALTKKDLVDEDTLELVKLEVHELLASTPLANAPLVACSSTTREGLDELVVALAAAAASAARRADDGPFRLAIDRAFTLRGFGTVVTGTATSGRVASGDEVELLPAGRHLRVRGVQVHGSASSTGVAGQRVAVNLGGIEHRELERGDVLATPRSHVASSMLDVGIELLPDAPEMEDLSRVRLHLGTAEVMARLRWAGEIPAAGGNGFGQLRLEAPLVAAAGDRFILRRYSPVTTIGGGVVLHPMPPAKLRPSDETAPARLSDLAARLRSGGRREMLPALVAAATQGASEVELAAWTGLTTAVVRDSLRRQEGEGVLVGMGEAPRRWLLASLADQALERIASRLEELHRSQPLVPGHPRPALRSASELDEEAFAAVVERGVKLGRLKVARDLLSLASHEVRLGDDERRALEAILAAHLQGGLQPPDLPAVLDSLVVPREKAQRLVRLLLGSGELVKLKDDMLVHGGAMAGLLRDMSSWYQSGQAFTVPDFKSRSGTSRKHAIPLLEYLDSQGLARRQGEGRAWLGPAPDSTHSEGAAATPPSDP